MPNTTNDEILEMVRTQLERDNPPDTKALYGRAARIDESVRELDLRQFNAKYVLQVRRQMKDDKKGPKQAEQETTAQGDAEVGDEDHKRVMELVQAAVEDDPEVGSKALYERAQEAVPAVANLSVQQFHARYPLQVKRQRARERKQAAEADERPASPEPDKQEPAGQARARARTVLLELARDVVTADRAELIDIWANLDEYADELVAALTE